MCKPQAREAIVQGYSGRWMRHVIRPRAWRFAGSGFSETAPSGSKVLARE
jgi:hypothetical protein